MDRTNPVNFHQIRTARALLDWSQEDLAAAADLSVATIRKIETGHISPRDKTMDSIRLALEHEKIEFMSPMGIRLRNNDIEVLDGEDTYLELMEIIYHTLEAKGGEVLFMYANNAFTSDMQIESQLNSRKKGIKFRFLVEEGNTHLHYPLNEYRWIPKKYFMSNLQVLYGNKTALCMYRGEAFEKVKKVVIIDSVQLADSLRNTSKHI